jgi:hypothetical protein
MPIFNNTNLTAPYSSFQITFATNTTHNLFNTAQYIKNNDNPDFPDLSFEINSQIISNSQVSNVTTKIINYYGEWSTVTLGQSILEILALLLFGHPNARAAISNDNDFVDSLDQTKTAPTLANIIQNTITTILSVDKNNIFNQYTITPQYVEATDANVPINFDFTGLILTFPLYMMGNVDVHTTKIDFNGKELNFINDTGSTVINKFITNGQYNIPIVLLFPS